MDYGARYPTCYSEVATAYRKHIVITLSHNVNNITEHSTFVFRVHMYKLSTTRCSKNCRGGPWKMQCLRQRQCKAFGVSIGTNKTESMNSAYWPYKHNSANTWYVVTYRNQIISHVVTNDGYLKAEGQGCGKTAGCFINSEYQWPSMCINIGQFTDRP
jgi:hypothetical protein